MPFVKGKSGNDKGKPKGVKAKKTVEWENFGKELTSHGVIRAKKIMDKAKDDQFMDYFFKLIEYFKPKLERTELTGSGGKDLIPPTIVISDPENAARYQEILKKLNDKK